MTDQTLRALQNHVRKDEPKSDLELLWDSIKVVDSRLAELIEAYEATGKGHSDEIAHLFGVVRQVQDVLDGVMMRYDSQLTELHNRIERLEAKNTKRKYIKEIAVGRVERGDPVKFVDHPSTPLIDPVCNKEEEK